MEISAKSWYDDFIKMLNKYHDKISNTKDGRFKATRGILNNPAHREHVINPSMIGYNNTQRAKMAKSDKKYIKPTQNIGYKIIGNNAKTKKDNYVTMFEELSKSKHFKKFFDNNDIEAKDIKSFGHYLTTFHTSEDERHEAEIEEAEELREKAEKERERRKKQQRKYIDIKGKLIDANETIKEKEEEIKAKEEEIEKQKEKDKEEHDKAMKDMKTKMMLEFDAQLKELDAKYKQAKKGKNKEERAALEAERKKEVEQLKQQIDEERKRHEEEINKTYADIQQKRINDLASLKNKLEERHEKDKKELLEEFQRNQKDIYGFAPNLEEYIKKKLATKAYSLDEDELIDKIARDIGKPGGLPKGTDPKLVAKAIYDRGAEETIKHIKKIANLAILTGYNNDLYNKLPGDVAQEVQKYITDKINDDIRKKNIKYILPKDKPRWEYAMQTKKLNPMLGRSAWRVN